MFKPIGLGDRIKDPISGFTGIVIGTTTWLHGCIRVGVAPESLKDGKLLDEQWFDQSRPVLVKKGVHQPLMLSAVEAAPEQRRSTGGPARESSGMRRQGP